MMAPTIARFSGCLIGQCLGDALGFPVEGYPPSTCRKYVRALSKDAVGGAGKGRYSFGQYTDDSQLARELVQSFVALKWFDPVDYARRIALIFAEGDIVGPGAATKESAERLALGIPWYEAGAKPPSAGNGSAMRAGPVGLIFFDDARLLVHAACDQGRITHQDNRCQAGAVAIAGSVALALNEGPMNIPQFISTLYKLVVGVEESLAEGINNLERWLDLPMEQAARDIANFGQSAPYSYEKFGIPGFVTPSVLWSIYSFLKSPEDYWESVSTAIIAGGDTDTTAAMTGAISGAHVGLGGLPTGLAKQVNDQGQWNYENLNELAEKLYEIKGEGD